MILSRKTIDLLSECGDMKAMYIQYYADQMRQHGVEYNANKYGELDYVIILGPKTKEEK